MNITDINSFDFSSVEESMMDVANFVKKNGMTLYIGVPKSHDNQNAMEANQIRCKRRKMEKKVGITTSAQSFGDNYGAILQAYALSNKLKSFDYIPLIIRYMVSGEYEKGKAPLSKRIKSTLFNRNISLYAKKTLVMNRLLKRSTNALFLKFAENHLQFYNEEYMGFSALKQGPPDLDAFITGSDQVWNPVIHNNVNDPGYFLDFVPANKRRIAYAPSMGVDRLPKACNVDLKSYLDKFYALSIREQSGADIIKSICNMDVRVVLDPTMLLTCSEWEEVCKPTDFLPDEYILCYKFGKSKIMDTLIKRLSDHYHLPVVAVPASPETRFKADYRIGPGEFLSAIKNARVICNDSFHASVFSIIYNKPFLTFPRHAQSTEFSMNSRMSGLLKTFELESQYITSEQQFGFDKISNLSFDRANAILQKKRLESIDYLKKSLQDI